MFMAHRSSVLQKNPFQYLPWSHHTLYIFCIGYNTIHRKLDPSKTVIKKNIPYVVATGQCDGGSSLSEILSSHVDLSSKKKSKKDHYISISSILIASLYETYMLWSDFRCQLLDELLRSERERERGGEINIFLIYVY